jgi:hypothetical protein
VIIAVASVAGVALWLVGSNVTGWVGTALHVAAIALFLLAVWTVISTVVLAMSLRVRNRPGSPPVR